MRVGKNEHAGGAGYMDGRGKWKRAYHGTVADQKYKLTGSTLTPTTRAAALTSVVRARFARAHAAQRASRQPQMVSPAHSAILETPYMVIDEKRIVRLVLIS